MLISAEKRAFLVFSSPFCQATTRRADEIRSSMTHRLSPAPTGNASPPDKPLCCECGPALQMRTGLFHSVSCSRCASQEAYLSHVGTQVGSTFSHWCEYCRDSDECDDRSKVDWLRQREENEFFRDMFDETGQGTQVCGRCGRSEGVSTQQQSSATSGSRPGADTTSTASLAGGVTDVLLPVFSPVFLTPIRLAGVRFLFSNRRQGGVRAMQLHFGSNHESGSTSVQSDVVCSAELSTTQLSAPWAAPSSKGGVGCEVLVARYVEREVSRTRDDRREVATTKDARSCGMKTLAQWEGVSSVDQRDSAASYCSPFPSRLCGGKRRRMTTDGQQRVTARQERRRQVVNVKKCRRSGVAAFGSQLSSCSLVLRSLLIETNCSFVGGRECKWCALRELMLFLFPFESFLFSA